MNAEHYEDEVRGHYTIFSIGGPPFNGSPELIFDTVGHSTPRIPPYRVSAIAFDFSIASSVTYAIKY